MYLFDFGTSVYVGLRLRYETICCHPSICIYLTSVPLSTSGLRFRYETICFMYLFDLGTSVYVLLKKQI